jgi:hypothetical protein
VLDVEGRPQALVAQVVGELDLIANALVAVFVVGDLEREIASLRHVSERL